MSLPEVCSALPCTALIKRSFLPLLILIAVPPIFGGCDSSERYEDSSERYKTFTARRGALESTVNGGGAIVALESQEVVSEARGPQPVKILYIVPEGTRLTEEDVAAEMILVELDSSAAERKLDEATRARLDTEAKLSEARFASADQPDRTNHAIRRDEALFRRARLDIEQFLGATLAKQLIAEAIASEFSAESGSETVDSGEADGVPTDGGSRSPAARLLSRIDGEIDFSGYLDSKSLKGGEAAQQLRAFEDGHTLAEKSFEVAKKELNSQIQLEKRGFTEHEFVVRARLNEARARADFEMAASELNHFKEYSFSTTLQKLLAIFLEEARSLQRLEAKSLIEMDMASEKLRLLESRYRLETKRIDGYRSEIDKHIIRAERPGLVVYGGRESRRSGRYSGDGDGVIRAGANVRERQTIITVPDMTRAAVNIKVAEASVQQLAVGQSARIRLDAMPDLGIAGHVASVAELPDANHARVSRSANVFETIIRIEGAYEWLKPGMSAEVEILVDLMEDALYVPLQSVVYEDDERACYVLERGRPARRVVETGGASNDFISITSGLVEGEEVLLRPSGVTGP